MFHSYFQTTYIFAKICPLPFFKTFHVFGINALVHAFVQVLTTSTVGAMRLRLLLSTRKCRHRVGKGSRNVSRLGVWYKVHLSMRELDQELGRNRGSPARICGNGKG